MTGIASAGCLVQGVFFAEYNIEGMEGKDHVFTNVRSEARKWIDENIYGYNPNTGTDEKKMSKKKNDVAVSSAMNNYESSGSVETTKGITSKAQSSP